MARSKRNAYGKTVSKSQETKRKRRKFPNVFFKKELTAIFENIEDPQTMMGAFLSFFCALRNSEVCSLKWIDVDLETKRLKVVDGKGGKDGFVPISSAAIPILHKWKAMHLDEEFVFPSESNELLHIQSSAMLKQFKRALKKANLEIPTEKNSGGMQQHQYKFHTLRHSRCTHLLNNGVPIQKVQYFMRHDDINTTMTYLWILNTELNQMVEEVDLPKSKIHQDQIPENNTTTITETTNYNDPLEIAKRRLAYGEISPREYKKITAMLQTPTMI